MAILQLTDDAPDQFDFLNTWAALWEFSFPQYITNASQSSITFEDPDTGDELTLIGDFELDGLQVDSGVITTVRISQNGKTVGELTGLELDAITTINAFDEAVFENNPDDAIELIEALEQNFIGSTANDEFIATDSNERLQGLAGDDFLDGWGGADLLEGGAGDDTLFGDEGRDTLDGGSGTDQIFGEAGDDQIIGSAGGDTIDGGEGVDSYTPGDGATQGWQINRNIARIVDEFGDVGSIFSVENFTGTNFEDKFVGSNAAEQVFGGAGNDTLQGFGGDDEINGQDGWDNLSGAAGNDTLSGEAGNDIINAGIGDDVVSGGAGDDKLSGGGGVDMITGGDGADTVNSGIGADTVRGGDGADRLLGGGGDDIIEGGAGDDFYRGQAGADQFVYLAADFGNDTLRAYNDAQDLFVIDSATGATEFSDLTITQAGEDVQIAFGGGSVTVLKRSVTQFEEGDFSFVDNGDLLFS